MDCVDLPEETEDFLTKQNQSMKEEASTRSKFYEQLESTLFELERNNTQLTRKHETDKKRIQSLCENIDYLERKCEEMSGTLETMRGESKKNCTNGKMSRNSYLSYSPSDSSEDDSYYFSKRRSHSLQDLRDYSSSPDEFDSHNSNSPDLKNSENEFIESLENRIEELLAAKKKEAERIQELEDKMRVLIIENDNLQERLNEVQIEKDAEIRELQRHLLDSTNYVQQTLPVSSQHGEMLFHNSTPTHTSSSSSSGISSLVTTPSTQPFPSSVSSSKHGDISDSDGCKSPFYLCKRCSAEINVRNLVNSIEEEDPGEFSSLEHELARATANDSLNHSYTFNHGKRDPSFDGSGVRGESWNYWGMKRKSLLDYFLFDSDNNNEEGPSGEEVGEEACEVPIDYGCNKPGGDLKRRKSDSRCSLRKLSLPAVLEDSVVGGGSQVTIHDTVRAKNAKNLEGVSCKGEEEKKIQVVPAVDSIVEPEDQLDSPPLKPIKPASKKTGIVNEDLTTNGEDEPYVCPPVTVYLTPVPESEELQNPFQDAFSNCLRKDGSGSPAPEYKEIFEKMFRLFDHSRRPDYGAMFPPEH